MKIIESQSATLTNYEVFTHLSELKEKYAATPKLDNRGKPIGGTYKRRGPGNYETVVKEVMEDLTSPWSPLANSVYNSTTIKTLLTRLRPYELTRAEILMVFNLRPLDDCTFHLIVEDALSRFAPDDIQHMITIIGEVLGIPEPVDSQDAMET